MKLGNAGQHSTGRQGKDIPRISARPFITDQFHGFFSIISKFE